MLNYLDCMQTKARFLAPFACLLILSVNPARADDYRGDVTDVTVVRRTEQQPGAALLWEPYIAQWRATHLVVAFGAGIPGKTDMGDILACVSTDEGKTWGESVYVFDHNQRFGSMQFGYANPILYRPPGQEVIWCFAMRCPMAWQHSEDSQLCAAYSGDGGRSWLPVELTMHYTEGLIVVNGIHRIEYQGHPLYLLPAHCNSRRNDPHGRREQFCLASTSLLEWKLWGFVPQPETGEKVFMHEGAITDGDAPGELKMVCRTAQYEGEGKQLDPARAYSTISHDGGRTWSPGKQEPDLWNSVSKGVFTKTAGGAHLYVYNDGLAWHRMSLRYKVQKPGGPWSEEKTFFDADIRNSYPTCIEHAPGEYYCVWDSGTKDRNRTHIHFGKLKL
jgi:hypothetical protein